MKSWLIFCCPCEQGLVYLFIIGEIVDIKPLDSEHPTKLMSIDKATRNSNSYKPYFLYNLRKKTNVSISLDKHGIYTSTLAILVFSGSFLDTADKQ